MFCKTTRLAASFIVPAPVVCVNPSTAACLVRVSLPTRPLLHTSRDPGKVQAWMILNFICEVLTLADCRTPTQPFALSLSYPGQRGNAFPPSHSQTLIFVGLLPFFTFFCEMPMHSGIADFLVICFKQHQCLLNFITHNLPVCLLPRPLPTTTILLPLLSPQFLCFLLNSSHSKDTWSAKVLHQGLLSITYLHLGTGLGDCCKNMSFKSNLIPYIKITPQFKYHLLT